jgi:hypothetical protein
MEYDAQQLARKLSVILQTAMTHQDEELSEDALARIVAEAEHEEFAYFYRTDAGDVTQGFTTAPTIRRYVSFLGFISLLDDELMPTISSEDISDPDRMERILADRAKDRASEVGIGVKQVAETAAQLLRDEEGDLPTVDRVYEAIDTDLAHWRFRWLMNLYTLGPTSLICWRWSPLLLPREYAKPE